MSPSASSTYSMWGSTAASWRFNSLSNIPRSVLSLRSRSHSRTQSLLLSPFTLSTFWQTYRIRQNQHLSFEQLKSSNFSVFTGFEWNSFEISFSSSPAAQLSMIHFWFHVPHQPDVQRQALVCFWLFLFCFFFETFRVSQSCKWNDLCVGVFPECWGLGALFNGYLIMFEEETRGRKMEFQNNIPSGTEEQNFLGRKCIIFAELVPLSLSFSVVGPR